MVIDGSKGKDRILKFSVLSGSDPGMWFQGIYAAIEDGSPRDAKPLPYTPHSLACSEFGLSHDNTKPRHFRTSFTAMYIPMSIVNSSDSSILCLGYRMTVSINVSISPETLLVSHSPPLCLWPRAASAVSLMRSVQKVTLRNFPRHITNTNTTFPLLPSLIPYRPYHPNPPSRPRPLSLY